MKIEISPYTAISLVGFLREFVKDDENVPYHLRAITDCVNEFEAQVRSNITPEELEEAISEMKVNDLIGKTPPMRGY